LHAASSGFIDRCWCIDYDGLDVPPSRLRRRTQSPRPDGLPGSPARSTRLTGAGPDRGDRFHRLRAGRRSASVAELLDLVHLPSDADRYPHELAAASASIGIARRAVEPDLDR
jgi:hypothetical protein